ncbi:MAG: hypothetical protein LUC20_06335 [Oscillospiraceae bacterium]|nr:hypothetical protein [Oscillospiraceae bacterium]
MRARRCAAALLALSMVLLCACRASPALEQVVYNQKFDDVSDVDTLKDNNIEYDREDEDIFSVKEVEESSSERGFEDDMAQYGEEENPEQQSANTDYDVSASDAYTTPEGVGEQTEQDSAGGDEGALRSDDGTSAADGEGVTAVIEAGAGSGEAEYKQVVLSDGTYIEVPAGLGTAAAVGEAAILVQMLGGSGALVAASEDFLANAWAQTVFADEGAASTPALWSGDGSEPLGDEAFAQLLEISPAVCFELSGQMTFTDAQIAQLEAAGIEYVVLPSLASASGIRSAVSIVGTVLGDRTEQGGQNAEELASSYLAWQDELIADLASRVDRFTVASIDYDNVQGEDVKYLSGETDASAGKYTLYISGWDSDVLYRISTAAYVEFEEYGLPVTEKGYVSRPLNYYMSIAGVVNMGAAALASTNVARWYVHPIRSVAHIKSIINGAEGVQFNNTNGSQTKFLTTGLGGEDYPAVVVANQSIKTALQSCTVWNRLSWPDQRGIEVKSTIEGSYEIYVNPCGVGSWADGSAESVLEAVWTAWLFHGAYTQDEVRGYIREFYSQFYRYYLCKKEISEIFAGKE